MAVIPILIIIGLLFVGGYLKRKNREKLKNEHLLFEVNGEMVMCTFQEAKDYKEFEEMRRHLKRNQAAYKRMKPKKWKIGSWSR